MPLLPFLCSPLSKKHLHLRGFQARNLGITLDSSLPPSASIVDLKWSVSTSHCSHGHCPRSGPHHLLPWHLWKSILSTVFPSSFALFNLSHRMASKVILPRLESVSISRCWKYFKYPAWFPAWNGSFSSVTWPLPPSLVYFLPLSDFLETSTQPSERLVIP